MKTMPAVPRRTINVPTVRATCPRCGDVDLRTSQVQVQICLPTGAATYSLQCPMCGVMVNKPATDRVVEALSQAGVRVLYWELPAELAEPKLGPPITHDDVLSFHLDLDAGSWQEELAGLRRRR
jgi:predicted RNA-binding Zn-ribbon protein involved in translation (DUF1610 family)